MRRKEMKAIWNAVCWEKQRRLSGFKFTPLCLPSIKRLACLLLQIFPQGGGVLQRREAYNKSLLYDVEGVKAASVPEAANGGHWFFWESTFLCLAAWALSGLHQQIQAAIFPLWGPSLELN